MAFATDSHLEDFSHLIFRFKGRYKDYEDGFSRKLPFYENINISERLSTNYAEYTPIGSNGSYFAFLGSKSRELELSFNLTLPHILEYSFVKLTAQAKTKADVTQEDYIDPLKGVNSEEGVKESKSYKEFLRGFDRRFFNNLTEREKRLLPIFNNNFSRYASEAAALEEGSPANPEIEETASEERRMKGMINILYLINMIRSSVITHSNKPWLGPPIIFLTHGLMYQDVPCICQSYSIDYDQTAGIDTTTLIPRVLQIKMSLREVRLRGANFAPGIEQGKYMPGWDSLFEGQEGVTNYVTMDPFGNSGRTFLTRG